MAMDYGQSVAWLYGQKMAMRGFTLAKMRKLVKIAGINVGALKTAHVAGSNGKGSTCAFIAEILKEEGYKTALYTSPHLIEPTERIRFNGKSIPKKKFAQYANRFRNLLRRKRIRANFFEIITAMALKYFEDEKVDFVVAETGMGGRLDATNVLDGIVNVITSISEEHTQYLGKTIRKIAREKAGIIKENSVTVISGKNRGYSTVKRFAERKNSELARAECKIISSTKKGQRFTVAGSGLGKLKITMIGKHQCGNAALAATAVLRLREKGFHVSDAAIRRGLAKTRWEGRMEIIKRKTLLIVDCAHNTGGWKALFKALKLFPREKLFVVFAVMNDKDLGFVRTRLGKARKVFLTSVDSERAEKPGLLREKLGFGEIFVKPERAVKTAVREAGKKDLVLVMGSVYLAGTALRALEKKNP